MFLSRPRETAITFAEPADGEPFSLTLADFAARVDRDMRAAAADGEAMRRVFTAAERSMRLVDNSDARNEALAEAAQLRIDIVREKTGVAIENPFRQGYHMEARRRVEAMRARGEFEGPLGPRVIEEQRNIFLERFDQVAQQFPEQAAALQFLQPLEDQARAIARGAHDDLERALASPDLSTAGALLAGLAGGVYGGVRDPLVAGSLFFGGGAGTAATVLGRIGQVALRESIINGTVMIPIEAQAQKRRAELDLPHGIAQALTHIGLGFLIGGAAGTALQGGREIARALADKHLVPVFERVARGEGSAEDIERVVTALGGELSDEQRATIRAAVQAQEADAIAGERPPAIDADQHAEIAGQAIRHAEDPINEPPPEIALPVPPRAADQVKIIDEALPAKPGEVETVDGKPVLFRRFDPGEIGTDAATFQFKGGGDEAGVTERLRHVTQWDALASGKVFVFDRGGGELLIADGHQRLGLAKRLQAEGHPPIRLDGYLFREADGWTAADVRALAAKKNLQEGSGDALDVARILRERPDILDGSLPITSPAMKAGVAVARLSDEAFGMAMNGVVPPNHAAAVGAMVPEPTQHAAVLAELARHAPETDREARLLIGEILSAGFTTEEQINLFGAAELTRSLMAERVKVLDQTIATLNRDKKLFGVLATRADVIEAAGNVLDREGNVRRATDAGTIAEIVARLASRAGPVSDALNRAAQRVADGEKPAQAARAFLEDVRQLVERDGLNALMAAPELRPAQPIEPGTPAAAEAAAAAAPEAEARSRRSMERAGDPGAARARTEATAAGEQILIEGVAPVTARERLELEAAKPLRGGDAAAGGLFDDTARAQTDLLDMIPIERNDGTPGLAPPEVVIADAERQLALADLVKSCRD